MQKKLIILFILICAITTSILIYRNIRSTKTETPLTGTTIVAFGDSLVAGKGATEGNDFPTVLSGMINEPIINLGISGNTTAQGLARIDDVITQDPKVVMVLLGGNDFLRKVPQAETFQNLNTIITKIKESGAQVILLGIRGGVLSDPYKEQFETLAKMEDVLYVPDVLSGLLTNSIYMSDTIHPNDAGYKKIAEKVYPILKKALE